MISTYFKVISGALVALVLCICLNKQGKEFGVLLSVCVCCMIASGLLAFFEPILSFVRKLRGIGNLDSDAVEIIVKIAGISILTELVSVVCTDAGNGAWAKCLQLLGAAVVFWLSIPVLEEVLTLVERILGDI